MRLGLALIPLCFTIHMAIINHPPMNVYQTINGKHDAPGYHYILFSADSILCDVYGGYANVEHHRKVGPDTRFPAFSVTKLFTAVAVMQLAETGQLDLNDPISAFLPQFPFSQEISIAQLLSHQSGLSNPMPMKWVHSPEAHEAFSSQQFSDSILAGSLRLKADPGKRFRYSNLNYLLLGRLIEVQSGMPYTEYITEQVLSRLSSGSVMGFELPEETLATGYHPNNWFQRQLLQLLLGSSCKRYQANEHWIGFEPFYLNGASYGGLISSPYGLMEFCKVFLNKSNQMLDQGSVERMLTPQRTLDGQETSMGLGWFKGSLKGQIYHCHAGGGGGYYCELRIYPELGIGSLVMTNRTGVKDIRLLDALDTPFLAR